MLISLRAVRNFLMWTYWRAQRAIGAAEGFGGGGGAVSPPQKIVFVCDF